VNNIRSLLTSSAHSPLFLKSRLASAFTAFALVSALIGGTSVRAQNNYTWQAANGGSGAWATSANWSPSGIPGTNPADTATITQTGTSTSALEVVTLGSSETIGGLTLNEASTGTIDLLLGSSSGTFSLTNSSTLALGGNATGTELLYLDGIDYTKNVGYIGNINVSSGGVLELSTSGNSTSAQSTVTGTVQILSGGVLNVDRPINSANAGNVNIVGPLSVASGGTITFNAVNSGNGTGVTTAITAPTGSTTALRFNVNGSFTAEAGSVLNSTASGTQTVAVYFNASSSGTASFNQAAGSGGTFFNASNELSESISYTGSAQNYSILSYNTLPAISLLPTGTYTSSQPVNITLGTPNGTGTLTTANLNYYAPQTATNVYAGTLEISLASNLTLTGNLNASNKGAAGETFIINTNGYTFDQSAYGALKTANVNNVAANWIYEGGGTLKATYFDMSVATGTGGGNVVGATTLWASGTGTTNLGSANGTALDPTSTFKYAGAAATSGSLTTTAGATNRAIGRLLVGDGSNTSTLSLASNVSGQGDVTVNAKGSLFLNGFNYTEASASTSNAGGLTSGGSTAIIANNGGGTSTLTLDATHGSGSFGGTIEDHATGTGTLALVLTGSGTQTLSSANTYSGGTTVAGGLLLVTNSTGTATGTAAVTVGGQSSGFSTASFGGTGTVAGLVTSAANGNVAYITPGATAGTVGTLHVGSLGFTIGAGTNFNFDLNTATTAGGTSNDLISMGSGTLAIGGTGIVFNFNQLSSVSTSGTYTLISGATSITGFNAADFTATGIGSDTATFSENAGGTALLVTFTAPPANTTGTYTLTETVGSSVLHIGATTTATTTLANTGSGTADSLNYSGVGATAGTGSVTGSTDSGTNLTQGGSTSVTQTYTATTAGSDTVSGTGSVTGANGTGSATLASNTGASVFVYTGQGTWTGTGSGSWGTVESTNPANWAANGGIPGITPGFTTTDSASFGNSIGSSAATVSLDGANPYLNAITFNNTSGGSYTVAAGTGGTVHLDATGTATVTNSSGNNTISAPVELDSAAATSVAGGSTLTLSGTVSDSGTQTLAINGPGNTVLSAANTYHGTTTVNSGTLTVSNGTNGSATGLGALIVASSGTLAGAGQINASSFAINGKLIVGSGADTTSQTTLTGSGSNTITNATLSFNLSSATVGQANVLNVGNSAITFSNSTLALNVGAGVIPANSDYVLVAGTGTNQYSGLTLQSETIGGQTLNVIVGGLSLTWAPAAANSWYASNSVLFLNTSGGVDDIEVDVVPEPGTWALMLGGFAMLIAWQRRKLTTDAAAKRSKIA